MKALVALAALAIGVSPAWAFRRGAAVMPAGILSASWASEAQQVWALAGAAGMSAAPAKTPGVDAWPAGCTVTNDVTFSGGYDVSTSTSCTLSGWNFSGHRVKLMSGAITVTQSYFDATLPLSSVNWQLDIEAAATATVTYNTFDGQKANVAIGQLININGGSGHLIDHNKFLDAPEDSIDGGCNSCSITWNYIRGGGWLVGGHPDQITIGYIASTNGVTISDNLFDDSVYGYVAPDPIRINPFTAAQSVSNVTVRHNIAANGAVVSYPFYSVENASGGSGPPYGALSNVSVTDNLWDRPASGTLSMIYCYTNTIATSSQNVAPSGVIAASGNNRLADGVHLTECALGNP